MSQGRRIHVGEVVTAKRVLTQADFDRFAELSGDDNPIHVDPAFAATTRFGGTVSHGMLLYGLIACTLSRRFPGAVQLEQELMFPNPAFADDEVKVELHVAGIAPHAREAELETLVVTAAGVTVCEGRTRVSLGA